jgi:hypothetical protein
MNHPVKTKGEGTFGDCRYGRESLVGEGRDFSILKFFWKILRWAELIHIMAARYL